MSYVVRKITVLLIACLCCCVGYAQKEKKVSATYRYVVPKNVSEEEAYYIALERAKQQAIADKFGTLMSQTNITKMEKHNGEDETDFFSLGQSLSEGEWVRNIDEPEFEKTIVDNQLVIVCTVKGYARRIEMAKAEFEAKILRNGIDSRFESNEFKDGDQFFMAFQTPKDGYVAVYLLDAEQEVTCLLPYASDADGQEPVKHGVDYVFFKPEDKLVDGFIRIADERSNGYYFFCEDKVEVNKIYIIFSPNPFTKVVDHENKYGGRSLSAKDFLKWLGEHRSLDPQMSVVTKDISVSK